MHTPALRCESNALQSCSALRDLDKSARALAYGSFFGMTLAVSAGVTTFPGCSTSRRAANAGHPVENPCGSIDTVLAYESHQEDPEFKSFHKWLYANIVTGRDEGVVVRGRLHTFNGTELRTGADGTRQFHWKSVASS